MKKIYSQIFILILLSFVIHINHVFGQKDTTKLNKEVEVIKPYRPNISTANKLNQLPVIEDTARFTPEFNYSIDSRPISSAFKSGPVSIQELKAEADQNNGIGYLKLGAGMYNSTYGDFFLSNNKCKNGSYGLHLKHFSSQGTTKLSKGDIVDSPYSNNKGEIYGNQIIGGSTLSGNLSYDRDVFRYYGYPDVIPVFSSLKPPLLGEKQQFQKAKIQVGLKSNDDSKNLLKYKSGLWYHFFDSKTGQQEKAIGLSADFNYQFEKFKGILETSYEHYTTNGLLDTTINTIDNKSVGLLKLAPSAQFSGENWVFSGGFSLYSVGSNLVGEDDIKLYPKIEFTFSPVKDILTLYAGINGYLQNCNYSAISYENNWVNPVHNVLNEDHQYILSGGLKGKINKEFNYKVELKYENVNDMHFYVLRSINQASPFTYNNSFDLVYDNTGITNFSAELSYVKDRDYYFLLKGNYYNYTPDHLSFAPQMPDFDIEGTAGIRLNAKITGFTDMKVTGERYGLIITPGENMKINLKPVYQLNVGADYELKSNFKIFGRIDNLLNQHYEQYTGYTSQGLRLIAGITFSF